MLPSVETDPESWQQLFASLTGDPTVDGCICRKFCDNQGVTPAEVMAKMQAHRQNCQDTEAGNSGYAR
jgi:hypothetical protein